MNKIRFTSLTASLVLAITFTISCEDKDPNSFKDSRDGKTYKKVTIGSQTWMAENLNYETEKGSGCYENRPENCEKYGMLYYWETALKACPDGWHLPSYDEFEVLNNTVGGKEVAGKKLKAKSGWGDYGGKSRNGTDDFGFSALPGIYDFWDGSSGGGSCQLWSATEVNADNAYNWYIYDDNDGTHWDDAPPKSYSLYNVRCIQD